ncbi:hypothetical protein HK104_001954 [Borealophlyctis nickersoniae]|nr:hypothetical protein HK104_001954 [Borealophlyctis nickersoniae]
MAMFETRISFRFFVNQYLLGAVLSTTLSRLASHSSEPPSTTDPLAQKAQEWFDEGLELWNKGDIEGALDAYEKSVWTRATGDGYYNIASCQYSLGKHESAIKSWKKSLELSPNRADAHVNIANLTALVLKDADGAVTHYEQALKIEPDDGEIRYNFGVVLDSMGRLEDAAKQYQKAVDLGVTVAEKNLRNAVARIRAKEAEVAASETPTNEKKD